jgi:chemotaxis protein methyltransferase CheR
MSIDHQEFSYIRELVHHNSGMMLESGKEYLVEARLQPLAESAGFESVRELIERLRSTVQGLIHSRVVEALTTNETSFFRDQEPFNTFQRTIVPRLIERRRAERTLNVWSAACSTGQEPYTIAIVLREYFPNLTQWRCQISASDIATKVIARARAGSYSQVEINRGMPAHLLLRYFERDKLNWSVRDEIRAMIDFFTLNLTRPWPALATMDVIFMRNVMIYFDLETKRQILAAALRQLQPDGYLLLGNAETTLGIEDRFERLPDGGTGWYRLKK